MSDAGCSSGNNDAPAYDRSDLMANPNPKSPKPNLAKVFAYQQMQRKLRLYHDSYVQEVKDALKADIEDFAVMNDFVTEFTTLVVVQAYSHMKHSCNDSANSLKMRHCFRRQICSLWLVYRLQKEYLRYY